MATKAELADPNRSVLTWARATVVVVFLAGLVVVVGPVFSHGGSSLFANPFTSAVERRTVETFDSSGTLTGKVVTTAPAGGSLVERSLAAGGVLLLRVAVVAAAAFLAGAVVYRTGTGNFPSEIFGVKFSEQVSAGLEKLSLTVEILGLETERLRTRLDASGDDLSKVRRAGEEGVTAIADVSARLDDTRGDIDEVSRAVVALSDQVARVTEDIRDLRPQPRTPRSPNVQ